MTAPILSSSGGPHLSSFPPTVLPMAVDWTCELVDADGLARPCGPAVGPFADAPLAALVLHINREAPHHGGEIALLLDLYNVQH